MITIYGEGRGFRVVWLLEEMGLPYRLRDVDLLAGVENDAEFLAINPAGFIPALVDGDVTMVESIAIMEYLMARYGPTPLAPEPHDPTFPAYQQFLHLGEAGLAASIYFVNGARNFAPEAERHNWSAGQALDVFETRLGLVTRQLARSPYLAGIALWVALLSLAGTFVYFQQASIVAAFTNDPDKRTAIFAPTSSSRRGERAIHARAVPAATAHVLSHTTAMAANTVPSSSIWSGTWPAGASTNCGSTAAKKTIAFGLLTPTTKPSRSSTPVVLRSTSACRAAPSERRCRTACTPRKTR